MKLYFRTNTKKMEIDTEKKIVRTGFYALPWENYITIKAEDFKHLLAVLTHCEKYEEKKEG